MIDKNHCRIYDGPPLEKGGTSTRFNGDNPTPSLLKLFDDGVFDEVETVLDYGAGKYGRNANFLRRKGFRVYAYDPFNGVKDEDGWEGCSIFPPPGKFDLGYTSFVLNVVPLHEEKSILKYMNKHCKTHYHIVRDDLFPMVRNALDRGDEHVTHFFLHLFASSKEKKLLKKGKLTDEIVMKFCRYGTKTSRGFQRLCILEDSGLTMALHKRGSFRVYQS